jgi:hypothetical protein
MNFNNPPNISLRHEPLLSPRFVALHRSATRRALSLLPSLSLQRGAKIRENGKRSASPGLPRTKATKPKTRKGNQIMKNRNIQFKATALRCKNTGLLLACLAAGLLSAPNPASASDHVPFHATLFGYVETSEFLPPCTIHGHSIVFGNATHLGAYTGTAELYQDVCNSTFIGSFHDFAANGDEIYGTFEGYLTLTGTPGVYDNHETADVTGGTGRFANATGHWEAGGQVDFTTDPISFVTPLQGWISTVGSTRH